MPTIRTFVDADVLIWGARGREPLSEAAMAVLTDPNREFVASDFLRLEVIPKAAYNKQAAEEAFYQRFFDAVAIGATSLLRSSPSLNKSPRATACPPSTRSMSPPLNRCPPTSC